MVGRLDYMATIIFFAVNASGMKLPGDCAIAKL